MKKFLIILALILLVVVIVLILRGGCGRNSENRIFEFSYDSDSGTYSVVGIKSSDVTDLVIPATFRNKPVVRIGKAAFARTELVSVSIPDSVTYIGELAFAQCPSLSSVIIGNGVTRIGDNAFNGCVALTSITIPGSVTNVGSNAFSHCSGLSAVHYVGDIAGWCGITFESVNGNPLYHAHNLYTNDILVTDLVIPDTISVIKDFLFYNCTSLTSVTIPDCVESIGLCAFAGCEKLTKVAVGNGVTDIGEDAFSGCTELSSINIPNSVTNIGSGAFYHCSGLTSITIPAGVVDIGNSAFKYCSSLCSVYWNAIDCGPVRNGRDSPIFENCTNLTTIIIGNDVKTIPSNAFSRCSLTSITIPASVTKIGSCAFYRCFDITSITFANTSGWYVEASMNGAGPSVSVTNPSTNAENLKGTYMEYTWYRK